MFENTQKIPLSQKFPSQPERQPSAHEPLTLVHPRHVFLHFFMQSCPKNPKWQAGVGKKQKVTDHTYTCSLKCSLTFSC